MIIIGFSSKDFDVFRYKVLISTNVLSKTSGSARSLKNKYNTKKYAYRKHLNVILQRLTAKTVYAYKIIKKTGILAAFKSVNPIKTLK